MTSQLMISLLQLPKPIQIRTQHLLRNIDNKVNGVGSWSIIKDVYKKEERSFIRSLNNHE